MSDMARKDRDSTFDHLRRFLTASRPTRYLVFALIGSWVWLWMVSEMSIFSYVAYTLIALAYLWLRPFSPLRYVVEEYRTGSKNHDPSKQKREFLILLAFVAVLGIVFTLRIDAWVGVLLTVVAALAIAVYAILTPGRVMPKRWLVKRRNR